MNSWEISNNKLFIENKGRVQGCAASFFLVLGFIIVLTSCGIIYLKSDSIEINIYTFFTILLLEFGVLAILAAINVFRKNFKAFLEFDLEREILSFSKNKKDKKLEISFSEFEKIRLVKQNEMVSSTGTARSRWVYLIFLIRKNGEHFFVDSTTNNVAFENIVQKLYDFIGLQIQDETDLGLEKIAVKKYSKFQEEGKFEQSNYVKIEKEYNFQVLSLKEEKSLFSRIVNFVLLCFVFTFPAYFLLTIYNSEKEPGTLFTVLGTVFLIIFFSLIFTFYLVGNKRYKIAIDSEQLIVKLIFKNTWLNNKFGKEIKIAKENIKDIRVNRLYEGHFWLSCVLQNQTISTYSAVMFGMGVFKKSKARSLNNNETILGLWEVPGYNDNEFNYRDLYYIKNWMLNNMV